MAPIDGSTSFASSDDSCLRGYFRAMETAKDLAVGRIGGEAEGPCASPAYYKLRLTSLSCVERSERGGGGGRAG